MKRTTKENTCLLNESSSLAQFKKGISFDGLWQKNNAGLQVQLEQIPVGTSLVWHFHQPNPPFFYVLQGEVLIESDKELVELSKSQGIHLVAGKKYLLVNKGTAPLQYILCAEVPIKLKRELVPITE